MGRFFGDKTKFRFLWRLLLLVLFLDKKHVVHSFKTKPLWLLLSRTKRSAVVPDCSNVFTTTTTTSLDRYMNQIFSAADLNQDGRLNFDECYELVLQQYIRLNRKAPIPPPTRATVRVIFCSHDVDQSGSISRDEFTAMVRFFTRRALVRLTAHKVLTWIAAPCLASYLVKTLADTTVTANLQEWVEMYAPESWVLAQKITSLEFWKTMTLILTVSTFGNVVLNITNQILDMMDKMPNTANASAAAAASERRIRRNNHHFMTPKHAM